MFSKLPQRPQSTFCVSFGLFESLVFSRQKRKKGVLFSLWQGLLSLTGAPYPSASVEKIQIYQNCLVYKEIDSKVGQFFLLS